MKAKVDDNHIQAMFMFSKKVELGLYFQLFNATFQLLLVYTVPKIKTNLL